LLLFSVSRARRGRAPENNIEPGEPAERGVHTA
jgi:hypothetical protein